MTDRTAEIPPVLRTVTVNTTPSEAFRVFTEEIGVWWPLSTHSVFGDTANGVRFDDGRLVELAADGRRTIWGEVTVWEPPQRLAFTWHPGSDAVPASRVHITFTSDGTATRVELQHDGWEAFGRDGRDRRRRYNGPRAWGYVLDYFADVAEPHDESSDVIASGSPSRNTNR